MSLERDVVGVERAGKPGSRYVAVASEELSDEARRTELEHGAVRLLRRARANNTRRAYLAAERQYEDFCAAFGYALLPGSVKQVCSWLHWLMQSGYAPSSIQAKLSAIRQFYRRERGARNCAAHEDVARVMDGIWREMEYQPARKDALTVPELRAILSALRGRDVGGQHEGHGLRDRALLAVLFLAGLRRSEPIRMRWEHVKFEARGVVFDIGFDKTQQRKSGRPIAIGRAESAEHCAVAALEEWRRWCRRHGGDTKQGPVFPVLRRVRQAEGGLVWKFGRAVSEGTVYHVVGQAVMLAIEAGAKGLQHRDVTPHSFRAGWVTALVDAGVSAPIVMKSSRHKSVRVMSSYHRPADPFAVNLVKVVGL